MATHFIIADAESHHVHAHVRWRLIRILTIDAFEEGVEYREYLDVTVVIDSHLTIGIEVEGVNHVHIVEVSSGSLVCDVHRMLQRQVPYRERLELGITGTDAALVFTIELTQAHSHLTAARTRSRDDDQRTGRLHIIILSETLVRSNQFHVVWIAVNEIVEIRLDAHTFQTVAELVGSPLSIIMGDDH